MKLRSRLAGGAVALAVPMSALALGACTPVVGGQDCGTIVGQITKDSGYVSYSYSNSCTHNTVTNSIERQVNGVWQTAGSSVFYSFATSGTVRVDICKTGVGWYRSRDNTFGTTNYGNPIFVSINDWSLCL